VFEVIRKIKPRRLYLASDGPRSDRHDEWEKVDHVRKIISKIDWDCDVQRRFNSFNQGCKRNVSEAISWLFEHENEGVILEDDCLPHPDFFSFCEEMLHRYGSDTRIWAVTGNNFQNNRLRGEFPYYFSKYTHVWGWATWRNRWSHYDPDLRMWPRWRGSRDFNRKIPDWKERRFWQRIFDLSYREEIDTWDFQWVATLMMAGGLTVTPQENLVTNIGFGSDATHTRRENAALSLPSYPMPPISLHPVNVCSHREADRFVFETVFSKKKNTASPTWWKSPMKELVRLMHSVAFLHKS
jgi:hypothetical protein